MRTRLDHSMPLLMSDVAVAASSYTLCIQHGCELGEALRSSEVMLMLMFMLMFTLIMIDHLCS